MQIGVIGSGIAGLVVSRRLSDAGHQVTLFEQQSSLGIDAHSLDIPDGRGGFVRADVPSRMFNQHLWPNLARLYEQSGVLRVAVDASQSFGKLGSPSSLRLLQANRPTLSGIASLLSVENRAMLKEAIRLQKSGSRDLETGIDPTTTLGEYLAAGSYEESFVKQFLYPTLSSTVFTCSYQSLDRYPARIVLDTLQKLTENDAGLYRSSNGTRDVAEKMLNDGVTVCLNCGVRSVGTDGDVIKVSLTDQAMQRFDHVVVSTQANHALNLLAAATTSESRMLKSFTYETVPVYVHSDTDLMPPKRSQWATFNMLSDEHGTASMCSVWLNRFHDDWNLTQPVFQTINAFAEPAPAKTIAHAVLQRPVVDAQSIAGLKSLAQMHADPHRRIWFCGSYACPGTPLLESGVNSAIAVSNQIERSVTSASS